MTLTFNNREDGLWAPMCHGNGRILCKWDTGAPCVILSVTALRDLVGSELEILRRGILNANTPSVAVYGFPHNLRRLHLCQLHNIYVSSYYIHTLLLAVDTDVCYDVKGNLVRKALIGRFFSDCCSYESDRNSNCIMTPSSDFCSRLNTKTLSMFNTHRNYSNIFCIDSLEANQANTSSTSIDVNEMVLRELSSCGHPELAAELLSILPEHDMDKQALHNNIQAFLKIKGLL